MSQEELTALRDRILNDITPLVLETAETGGERFSLLLRLIQAGSASGEVYKKAYENAKAIEDKEEQLSALMALLDEVDFDIQKENDSEPPVDEPQSTSEVQPMSDKNENDTPPQSSDEYSHY